MRYRYTSFLSSKSSVCMQLTTSGKSIDTSLPTVIAAMTFLTASFFLDLSKLRRSSLNSWISPACYDLLSPLWSIFPETNPMVASSYLQLANLSWWWQSIYCLTCCEIAVMVKQTSSSFGSSDVKLKDSQDPVVEEPAGNPKGVLV